MIEKSCLPWLAHHFSNVLSYSLFSHPLTSCYIGLCVAVALTQLKDFALTDFTAWGVVPEMIHQVNIFTSFDALLKCHLFNEDHWMPF